MIVYADVLFLINFIASYVMLRLIERLILKRHAQTVRVILAAAVGGIASVIIFCVSLPPVILVTVKTLSAVIMVFTAFFIPNGHVLRTVLWLFALSEMVIAAAMMLTMLLGKTTGVLIKYGTVYFDIPARVFLPLIAVSYAAVAIFMKILQNRRAKKRYSVTITHSGRKITVTALFDSGNLLRDPISGKCVSVLEWDKARELLDADYAYDALLEHADEIIVRAIPYRSIDGNGGTIYAFTADEMEIPEEKKTAEKTLIGLYNGRLSADGEYNALINSALL